MIGNQNGTEEVEARGKGEHSYYKWKGLCVPQSGRDCNAAEEWVRGWKIVEGLLEGYGVLWSHGVMTVGSGRRHCIINGGGGMVVVAVIALSTKVVG